MKIRVSTNPFAFFLLLWLVSHLTFAQDEEIRIEQSSNEDINLDQKEAPKQPETRHPQCDPNIPNLSVGDHFLKSEADYKEFKKNHNTFILAISSANCETWCLGEIILKHTYDIFANSTIAYKNKSIPIIRIDYHNFEGNIKNVEDLYFEEVPKIYFYHNSQFNDYRDALNLGFFLNFINRHLYPVVNLKTEQDIDKFMNTSQEWIENTPFWKTMYFGYGQFFPQFRKSTRVIAFIYDKKDYKDEIKQLNEAAYIMANRDDLRVAKVTNPELVKIYKEKYRLKWFSAYSSNSLVMLKKDINRELITKKFDLSTERMPMVDWISSQSLEPLEELSGASFKIMTLIKKPVMIAFLNKNDPRYRDESLELYKTLENIAHEYSSFILTFTEDDRYRNQKDKMGISWEEEPSMTLNNILTNEFFAFPRGKPFTVKNVKTWFNSLIEGTFSPKTIKLPDTYKEYLLLIKDVMKVKPKNFADSVIKNEKDVVMLIYNSEHITPEVEIVLKSFNKAAIRFKDQKIKSVRLVSFNVAKQKLPDTIDLSDIDQVLDNPKVLIFSSKHKDKTPIELKKLDTENIMKSVQAHADTKFELPKFPHLTEAEFLAYERGDNMSDL